MSDSRYWDAQHEIYISFCECVDALNGEAIEDMLEKMSKNPNVHEYTLKKCEDYLNNPKEWDSQYDEERKNHEVESHLYPSEGHDPY